MLKVLFNLAVIIIVGYIIYIKLFKKPAATNSGNSNNRDHGGGALMVGCDKCGTYVESKDGINKDGKFYCSKECAGVR